LEIPVDDGNDFDLDIENINLDDPLGLIKPEKVEVKNEKNGTFKNLILNSFSSFVFFHNLPCNFFGELLL